MILILGEAEVKADFIARWLEKYVLTILDYARKCHKKIIDQLLCKQGL